MPVAPNSRTRERLHSRHRELQAQNAKDVAGKLGAALRSLPNLSDESRDIYVSRSVPIVAGGQRRAASLAAAYVRFLAGAREGSPALELGRRGVTAESGWVASPVARGRAKLAADLPWSAAIDAASTYAAGLASCDLQVAVRFGADAGAKSVDAEIIGWRMELSPSACDWCQMVSGEAADNPRAYHDPDGLPFHEHCQCAPAPIFADEISS